MGYMDLSAAEWQQEYNKVSAEYESWKAKGLKLNMARGKPSKKQLDLVSGLLTALSSAEDCVDNGVDARNYGELKGLESARKLFADILGCKASQVFAGGNSSLQLMYDTVSKAYTHGLLHSERPWCKEESVKWLCPAPGYDRHFKITESFGFELITIPMTENGPDMDIVENLIKDSSVKGMWNVPKYSNPDGIIYSDETIRRIVSMKPAAPDFLLMWDNAYCIHEFDGDFVPFPDILSECEKYGNADMVFEFASTSKVTLPGAGISCFACSEANMEYMCKRLTLSYPEIDVQKRIFRRIRIFERYVSELHRSAFGTLRHAARNYRRRLVKHLVDTLRRDLRLRQQHKYHNKHHKRHNNIRRISAENNHFGKHSESAGGV